MSTNTAILIKRSSVTQSPGILKSGELGYSYVSNTLFFGTVGGDGVVNVGGQLYTTTIDSATQSNTASTLVKRDPSGAFAGQLYGNANSATILQTAQNFSVSGGDITASAVSFDGTSSVTLDANLNAVPGLSAGIYGGSTQSLSTIPVITVAANGRVMQIANTSVTSSFNISDGTNSNTIYSGSTEYFTGTKGVTTTVSANTVTFGTDNTVLRSNTVGVGQQTISTDLTIAGNLIVSGTQTFVNTTTFETETSLIELAANNNISDIVDIGFYGQSHVAGSNVFHGLIREGSGGSSAGSFFLFKNLTSSPTGNTVNYAGLSRASLVADLSLASGYPLANVTNMANGANTFLATPTATNLLALVQGNTGTGNLVFSNSPSFTTPNLGVANAAQYNIGTLTYSATNAFNEFEQNSNNYVQVVIQNANTGTQASADYVVSNAVSADNFMYGDFGINGPNFQGAGSLSLANAVYLYAASSDLVIGTASANSIHFVVNNGTTDAMAINGSNGAVTLYSALGVSSGGTGSASFTSGQLLLGNGSGALSSLANTSYIQNGVGASNNTITSVVVDAYGRFTDATFTAISGLTVQQGGTGLDMITQNGIVFGNGIGAMGVTGSAGVSDQTWSNQILTVTNTGVPVWTNTMDGGTF
jgi:hypothetical protein